MSARDDISPNERQAPEAGESDLLLAQFNGARPPAPDWFEKAVETPARTGQVTVDGAVIGWRQWGDPDKPGLLLVHGNGAHAHWWDFIAPQLAEDWNVVAPDFSGMGDSDWREAYSFSAFSAEQLAVCEAAGLFAHEQKPIIVAHSFGGLISLSTAINHGERFSGAVIVDSHVEPPGDERPRPPKRQRGNRVYPDFDAALARFRLAPPQPCANAYAVDYIARHSIKDAIGEDGAPGFTWKFDPFIFSKLLAEWDAMDFTGMQTGCPLVFMRGELSSLVTPRIADYMANLQNPPVPTITIPGAYHHVWLDQPLAFVSALRGLFATWPVR